jgi:hypothetical protein
MNGWLRAAIREVDEVMAGCTVETTPIKDHKGEREQPSEMPRLNSKKKVCYMSDEIGDRLTPELSDAGGGIEDLKLLKSVGLYVI